MTISSSDLRALKTSLQSLCEYIHERDEYLCAMVDDTIDSERLDREAANQFEKFHVPEKRTGLFGKTLGIKDIINADQMETRCGTALPAHLFQGREATCIDRLRRAGMVMLGKTQTTEFACLDPGPTRNPLDTTHSPGGSSSGSAAAVAAGFCDVALGTQTIGSVIRPAAYCGIVGFKPTYDRVPVDGVFPFSKTVDSLGFFCKTTSEMPSIAAALLDCWGLPQRSGDGRQITLGIPDNTYLKQADTIIRQGFDDCTKRLQAAGYRLKRTAVFKDIEDLNQRHQQLVTGEMYRVHREFVDEYRPRYRPLTIAAIDRGAKVDDKTLSNLIRGQREAMIEHTNIMRTTGVDFWVAPASATLAPAGLESTGDPVMNLPFTHLGLPTVSLPMHSPSTQAAGKLRHGLQVAAPCFHDEELVELAIELAPIVDKPAWR